MYAVPRKENTQLYLTDSSQSNLFICGKDFNLTSTVFEYYIELTEVHCETRKLKTAVKFYEQHWNFNKMKLQQNLNVNAFR